MQTYKKHREQVLRDRERARLPSTQEDAVAVNEAWTIVTTSRAERMVLQNNLEQTQRAIYQCERRLALAREVVDSIEYSGLVASNGTTA
jgi:hypothetical protein